MRFAAAWVLLAVLPAFAPAQSLGDAARKEQERRRRVVAAGEKARVITDSELNAGRATPSAKAAEGAAATGSAKHKSNVDTAPESAAGSPPSDGQASDDNSRLAQEDLWRQRMQEARNRVEQARRRHEYLSTLVMVPGKYYVDADDRRPVITSTEQLQQLTAAALADVKAAEQAQDELEERARRAGVPPGWLR